MNHIPRDKVVGLAALDPIDAEASVARRHASTCAACAEEMRQAEATLRAIDALPRPPPPSNSALDATRSLIFAELDRESPAAHASSLWSKLGPFLATLIVWAVLIGTARFRSSEERAWIEALAALVVAGVCSRAVIGGASWLLLACGAASAGLAASASSSPDLNAVIGLKCVALELAGAAVPFYLAWRAVRRGVVRASVALFVGAAGAGALAAQAALHLSCPAQNGALHEWIFHFGGVLLAMFVGWMIAARFASARFGMRDAPS